MRQPSIATARAISQKLSFFHIAVPRLRLEPPRLVSNQDLQQRFDLAFCLPAADPQRTSAAAALSNAPLTSIERRLRRSTHACPLPSCGAAPCQSVPVASSADFRGTQRCGATFRGMAIYCLSRAWAPLLCSARGAYRRTSQRYTRSGATGGALSPRPARDLGNARAGARWTRPRTTRRAR